MVMDIHLGLGGLGSEEVSPMTQAALKDLKAGKDLGDTDYCNNAKAASSGKPRAAFGGCSMGCRYSKTGRWS